MLTFRGAPPGKGLEAWRDNFSLKVGATKIPALISKKYSKNIGFGFWMGFDIWMGKEGARAQGPQIWAQIWALGSKIWALGVH